MLSLIQDWKNLKLPGHGKSQPVIQTRKRFFTICRPILFDPSFIVDISEHFKSKMKSVKAFKSQFHNPTLKEEDTFISKPEFLDYVEARAKFYGFQIRKKYGEPFYCEEKIKYDFADLF